MLIIDHAAKQAEVHICVYSVLAKSDVKFAVAFMLILDRMRPSGVATSGVIG